MNLWRLSLAYLRARPLDAALNVLLLALGVGTITMLLLVQMQLKERLGRDARGIDLVVGAKGSPMQLILSSVYHLDVPTGNIPLEEAERLQRNPAVRASIPLALGDSHRGFRIVGTTPDYIAHYDAVLATGRLWQRPMEAVLGAEAARETGLTVSDQFVGAHGLVAGGMAHDDDPLTVVGVLAPSGTVLDRLILTGVETVWQVHEHHAPRREPAATDTPADNDAHAHGDGHAHAVSEEDAAASGAHDEDAAHDDEHGHDHDQAVPAHDKPGEEAHAHEEPHGAAEGEPRTAETAQAPPRELTALLIAYRSPLSAALLPRQVNSQSALQAASPAFETARLLRLVGVGTDTLRAFGALLVLGATLGVFIALYNALRDRRYDLAIMRTLGATRTRLLLHVFLEAQILTWVGTLLGIALGHVATGLVGTWLEAQQGVRLTGLAWAPEETWLLGLAVALGFAAALLPAIATYRRDIATTLARG